MATPKERHYWGQLRAAMTAGQWRSLAPAKAPHGHPLSWSELFRKFNKHCKGFEDVSEIASRTRDLALLLATDKLDEDEDELDLDRPRFNLDHECLLPPRRVTDAQAGYLALQGLDASTFDTTYFALAYYAYAQGNFSDCLQHLEKIPQLLHFQNHIPNPGSTRSTAQTLNPPSTYSSASFAASFTSVVDTTVPEVRDGRGWAMAETFRSLCLQGMAHERLHPDEPEAALKAYSEAIPLFQSLRSEFTSKSVPQPSGKLDFGPFQQLRELWRWVERLIWRAVVLSSKTTQIQPLSEGTESQPLWIWLGHYKTCSAFWPANFRTSHRSAITSLYLRALILQHGPPPTSSSVATNRLSKPQSWVTEARSIIQDYRAILSASTRFPRAGQQNSKVEEFVDLCVAVWEAAGGHGEQASWVIDILWWATRLTFNSSRVLRHMTRLLYLSGDISLAKRTLRLYTQVVSKAYETSKEGVGEDKDSDELWVETLIFGARMLCKEASGQHGLTGVDNVHEAASILEKAKTRLDESNQSLVAKYELARGVVESLLAIKGHDPLTRNKHLNASHAHLLRSVAGDRTALGCYHLSLSFATRGPHDNPDKAIEWAAVAVELNSQDVRYWHLLGLLLTKQEKWKEALEILENGAALDEMDEITDSGAVQLAEAEDAAEETITVTQSETQTVSAPTSTATAQLSSPATRVHLGGKNDIANGSLFAQPSSDDAVYALSPTASDIPPAATLLRPELWSMFPPTRQELFEYHLQLRMTQATVVEALLGPEGAEVHWVDVFSWVAEKRGANASQTTTIERTSASIHTTVSQLNIQPPSEHHRPASLNLSQGSATGTRISRSMLRHSASLEIQTLEVPIPITVSPATPDVENTRIETISIDYGIVEKEGGERDKEKDKARDKEKKEFLAGLRKRSASIDQDTLDVFKPKKMGQMLKNRVHKGRAGITAVSRRIGNGVTKNGGARRSSSTPDFHAVLQQTSYQASSIHSRRRLSSIMHSEDRTPTASPPPPPPPVTSTAQQDFKLKNDRSARENRLLSELWLMSAATFRRLSKVDQAKGSIQEAEVKDENNPNVWVQLGLYYVALGWHQHAMDAFQKALFISPDDVSATVHLARLYLDLDITHKEESAEKSRAQGDSQRSVESPATSPFIDLAASLLAYLVKGRGWDVAEAWYYLAKAYGLQGQKAEERETLTHALRLAEKRTVRDIGLAVGCISFFSDILPPSRIDSEWRVRDTKIDPLAKTCSNEIRLVQSLGYEPK